MMAERAPLRIEDIVPGGVLASDHAHRGVNDGTCSRCRQLPPEGDVPLMLWRPGGWSVDLMIYCQACLGENDGREGS